MLTEGRFDASAGSRFVCVVSIFEVFFGLCFTCDEGEEGFVDPCERVCAVLEKTGPDVEENRLD